MEVDFTEGIEVCEVKGPAEVPTANIRERQLETSPLILNSELPPPSQNNCFHCDHALKQKTSSFK